MVLGANLYPIKAGQVESIFSTQQTAPLNSATKGMTGAGGLNEDLLKQFLSLKQDESLKPPKSALEFEKFFCKKLQDPLQRYTYLILIDPDQVPAIFISDVDSEVLL